MDLCSAAFAAASAAALSVSFCAASSAALFAA